jgi:thiamine monophosphate synthase
MPCAYDPRRARRARFAIADWAAAARAPRLDLRLYAVTDPGCDARCGRSRADAAAAALAGGVTLLQLHEKAADGAAFLAAARELVALAAPHGARARVGRL